MSKVLITGDLHIKNHRNYNHIKPRLEFYLDLADDMVKTCIEQNISEIIIAGDILDAPNPSPLTTHTWFEFLGRLTKVANVYLIHGNHDADAKLTEGVDEETNSLISLGELYPRVKYLHREYLNIGGRDFYFRGWTPSFEAVPSCDVFIGHGYVDGAVVNAIKARSDVKDINSCKLAFIGDIHIPQQIKNIVIPGSPMQNHFGDPIDTSYVVLELSDLTFTRQVPRFPRLKFIKSKTHPNVDDPYIVWKPRIDDDNSVDIDMDGIKAIDFDGILSELLDKYDGGEAIRECLGKHQVDLSNANRDLKFEFLEIELSDFRSIESYTHSFDKPLTVIVGENGSGKTTLFSGLQWVLKGKVSRDLDSIIRKEPSGRTSIGRLVLKYNGQIFQITRKHGAVKDLSVKVKIGDTWETAFDSNNRRDLQTSLEETLPFINKLHLLYFKQSQDGILSEFNDAGRVGLVADIAGLTIVDNFTRDVDNFIETKSQLTKNLTLERVKADGILQGLKLSLDPVEDPSGTLNPLKAMRSQTHQDLTTYRTKCSAELNQFDRETESRVLSSYQQIVATKSVMESCERESASESSRSKILAAQITQYQNSKVCPTCDRGYDEGHITHMETLIADNRGQIEAINLTISKLNKKFLDASSQLQVQQSDYSRISGDRSNEKIAMQKEFNKESSRIESILTTADEKIMVLTLQHQRYLKYIEATSKVHDMEIQIQDLEDQLSIEKVNLDKYTIIRDSVFGSAGLLVAGLLKKIGEILNTDEQIRVETYRSQKNGKVKPTLDLSLNVGKCWIPYEELSGGQKLYVDLYFLSRIIELAGGVGFLALDEVLKYADYNASIKCLKLIESIKCKNKMLIYHGTNLSDAELTEVDVLKVSINSEGVSSYGYKRS